ncbi:UDP-N-acetylglucosamine--undecaprenyl-phosphate N-acetylglucosaminephosphotransferase [Pantoea allii]|uniref:Undecaprenyl-phosphate alpha-N-acetylglucosaminyl 1-phosphate transferase n=1 Tax=Pantoea allii TaxID=574096 RepID=A0ABS6VGH0_9GAMM|nr:UDP-N-acetylglucosamine--undecaprenyl-phosphate N-acetylglucosaminephosphotransferase [Pantoea allii]MBW1214764.1 UDP-N-acetylglucosamine--undecaprenyl-phosphate N-acetylglucosaminephosphotransferase [Pantoea allii]MBW1258395.1 UDP-N-acetylglucosamine--undecaprenyl-phosphate N-acetylglucosaminephosphotransferase [Pantoea allii]MBW1267616.1 UDP-N-acetylglucosamine--undecaprenyl-phosphate N-acetylglucosaminephosphotransferase [Pantoea allii]MBW1289422.1 UDP-N-acetylglucosamine--undecaprenyl-ph
MQEIVCVFLSAFALLFIARKVARKVGLVDKPNDRKQHKGHIPLVGGVSVYLSLWILYLMQPGWLPDFTIYMFCATVLLAVGVLDDRFDLPVMPRIMIQALMACIMMWNGYYLYSLGNVLFGFQLVLGIFGYAVTLFAVIGAINAFNMVDGIDGLLGALSCVTFGALGIVFELGGNKHLALWCTCLMAACLPYILLNLGIPWGKKFKVFMGDAGSTLIGFTVIWLLMLATQGTEPVMRPVTALWLIAVPLMDMVRVMTARIRRGSSPFKPDREHLHHLLMRGGLTGRGTLVVMVACAAVLAATGIGFDAFGLSDCWQLIFFIGIFFTFNAIIYKSARFHRVNQITLTNQNDNNVFADKY